MTLSFDHSVIDGAPAARFAATFRQLLETGAALDTPAAPGRRGNAHDDGNRNALGLPT
jgi:2-oxoacid dehydrogenases acyltransferase (catalytic domain)